MHPLQIIFIAMMLCVLAYLALNVIGWVGRRLSQRHEDRYDLLDAGLERDMAKADETSQVVGLNDILSSRPAAETQTDRQTDQVSALAAAAERVQLDRTRTAVIEVLVLADWQIGQIRAVLKGDNGTIGTEVAEARQRLGLDPPPARMLPVKDNGGPQRVIPWDAEEVATP